MTSRGINKTEGSAIVAFILVTVIILGSMLMLHTAAVVTIGGTSRALEIARQNAATALRLERTTGEAAQSVFGNGLMRGERGFRDELNEILRIVPLGALEVTSLEISQLPEVPRMFPDLSGPPSPLIPRSSELELLSTPELMAYTGARVAESSTFEVNYTFSRAAVTSVQTYSLEVKCRLVCVPVTRYGVMSYDLPEEVGQAATSKTGFGTSSTVAVGPRGLVPSRDSADIPRLTTGSKRPGHFRFAAALSETYQYIFSKAYLQKVADYAGATHLIQIGAGTANPLLSGGAEEGNTYTLDIGRFGEGNLGPKIETKNAAAFYATSGGCSLVLNDSGGNTSPILLVIAGPADRAAEAIILQIGAAIQRPIVLVCYHVQLQTLPNSSINGALLLDRDSTISSAGSSLAVGHVSYWAGSNILSDTFRITAMPPSAEDLVPRAVYVAAAKTFL